MPIFIGESTKMSDRETLKSIVRNIMEANGRTAPVGSGAHIAKVTARINRATRQEKDAAMENAKPGTIKKHLTAVENRLQRDFNYYDDLMNDPNVPEVVKQEIKPHHSHYKRFLGNWGQKQ